MHQATNQPHGPPDDQDNTGNVSKCVLTADQTHQLALSSTTMDTQSQAAGTCKEGAAPTFLKSLVGWVGMQSTSCSGDDAGGEVDYFPNGVSVGLVAASLLSVYAFSTLLFRWNCAEYMFISDVLGLLFWAGIPTLCALTFDTGVLILPDPLLATCVSVVISCVSFAGIWWVRTRQVLAPRPGKSVDMTGSVCVVSTKNAFVHFVIGAMAQ
jgi:hypothetical protein